MTNKIQRHIRSGDELHSGDEPKILEANNLKKIKNLEHGFFTRIGGVSKNLYAALNCGYSSNDQRDNISKNLNIVAKKLGVKQNKLLTCKQSHTNICHIIDENNLFEEKTPADAMVTKLHNVAISVLSADCAPILFADRKKSVIGAAHAGWRGAFKNVMHQTITAMQKIGSEKKDIIAALGPTICQNCYSVSEEFFNNFIAQEKNNQKFFKINEENILFDLTHYIIAKIQKYGIKVEKIDLCTYENPHLFFSYRYNTHKNIKNYGRQIATIMIKNEKINLHNASNAHDTKIV